MERRHILRGEIMEKVTFKTELCKGCGLCATVCPKKIIYYDDSLNAKGFHPAVVDKQEECIACGSCAIICPDVVITVRKEV